MALAQHRQTVSVPLKVLFDTIMDFNSYSQFAGGVKKSQILSKDASEITVRMEVELMKRIDYTITVKSEFSGEAARISWTLKEGDFFQQNDGLWELTSTGPDSTAVLYQLDLDFSVSVPSFILKGLIKTSLPKAVQDFSEEAKRRMK